MQARAPEMMSKKVARDWERNYHRRCCRVTYVYPLKQVAAGMLTKLLPKMLPGKVHEKQTTLRDGHVVITLCIRHQGAEYDREALAATTMSTALALGWIPRAKSPLCPKESSSSE